MQLQWFSHGFDITVAVVGGLQRRHRVIEDALDQERIDIEARQFEAVVRRMSWSI